MGRVSFVETGIPVKSPEQEVSRWEGEGEGGGKSIPGTGPVQTSGQQHPLLVPGLVVAVGPAGERGGEKGFIFACSLTLLPSSCKDTNDYVGPTWIMFPSQGPQINYICKTESGVLVRHPAWSKPLAFKTRMGGLSGSHNSGQGGIGHWILGLKSSHHTSYSPSVSPHSSLPPCMALHLWDGSIFCYYRIKSGSQ